MHKTIGLSSKTKSFIKYKENSISLLLPLTLKEVHKEYIYTNYF